MEFDKLSQYSSLPYPRMVQEPANLIVLRRDTATGLCKVGWSVDMPLGRFEHIQKVCETRDFPDDAHHAFHERYRAACRRAVCLNQPLIEQKRRQHERQGCVPVPLDLAAGGFGTTADDFGSYLHTAMQTLYRLTANATEVWAVVNAANVVQVQPCSPPRAMESLEYQVWKNHCLATLMTLEGEVYRGRLKVCESGLWFCAQGRAVRRVENEP